MVLIGNLIILMGYDLWNFCHYILCTCW